MCNRLRRHGWRSGHFKQGKLQHRQGCCGYGRCFISAGILIRYGAVCVTSVRVELVCMMENSVCGRVKNTARRRIRKNAGVRSQA